MTAWPRRHFSVSNNEIWRQRPFVQDGIEHLISVVAASAGPTPSFAANAPAEKQRAEQEIEKRQLSCKIPVSGVPIVALVPVKKFWRRKKQVQRAELDANVRMDENRPDTAAGTHRSPIPKIPAPPPAPARRPSSGPGRPDGPESPRASPALRCCGGSNGISTAMAPRGTRDGSSRSRDRTAGWRAATAPSMAGRRWLP
jgi:hypothetical protein